MQSSIGGATDYSEQSCNDILKDIQNWIVETQKIDVYMNEHLNMAKVSGFWQKVDCDFQITLLASTRFFKTIISDLRQVESTIQRDCISESEVRLLRNIGNKAVEYNDEYGKAYHRNHWWQDYDNPDFKVVEDMYREGRDFFVSLQDAQNASSRLEDYMNMDHSNKTITVNFNGNVSGSQIQVDTRNSVQNNVDETFPYNDVLKTLREISKYKESLVNDLQSKGEEFSHKLDILIEQTQKKEKPSIIKNGLNTLRDFLLGVSESLAASKVLYMLKQLPLK
ncbi:MAG: hypothetical protein SOT60_10405 [Bilifractor sp.]|nr:hypothetical protein [Lachnospiraceae bacterium]MDY2838327.1 hypothetical protein [Bilifractor sp.]